MKRAYVLLSLLGYLLTTGCCLYPYKLISERRLYPKKPDYCLQPSIIEETALNYESIYINHYKQHLPDGSAVDAYNFMRFWPNGRFYVRCSDVVPDTSEAESFVRAYMGYYNIEGSNIVMELYIPNIGYCLEKGHFDAGSIDVRHSEPRHGRQRDTSGKQRYYRKHIGPMIREPDW